MKRVVVFFVLVLSIPLVFSISIKDLISKYSFSAATQQTNVTNHTDFMIDKNNNSVNDTLVFELTTNNTAGTFIFVINLFDKNGVLTNETNRTLSTGLNNVTITFPSILLSQSQFNYSIKIYNASRRQKYRKDNILTQNYPNYEEGFRVLNFTDSRIGKTLSINLTVNSPENKSHVTTLFLKYNNSIIFSKGTKIFTSPTSHIGFNFGNETIKKTHFEGNFTISSIKIGFKTLKIDSAIKSYDFRDFAATSYIYNFTDNGVDINENGKYDFLQVNASLQVLREGNYTIASSLYDLFDNLIETKNISSYFDLGNIIFPIKINGSLIYGKKLNGPYILKIVELYENMTLVDKIADAYATGSYNYNDFDNDGLPDIAANISSSDAYRYGIGNLTINFTFENIGARPAFNVAADIFDNMTFAKSNKSNVLNANSKIVYQINFTNMSDFEITAIADLQNAIEEMNESNNAFKAVIKLNKKPVLAAISNITSNETDKIIVNLSASDSNGDNLSYSINLSKFSNNSNIFEWNTTVTDSGNYLLKAAASDGYLNDTLLFRLIILDAPEKDMDNDGIDDDADSVIGFESSVNASGINLSIMLNQSKNLSKLFRHNLNVMFMDGLFPLAEFDYNFSRHKLRLHNLTFRKQFGNSTGYLLSRGMNMHGNATKTLYVDKINATDGNSYMCAYNSTIGKYKVQGLKHSGIVQIDYNKPSDSSSSSGSSSGGGGGGGGGGSICISNWQCDEWIRCIDGFRNRKCADENQCAFPTKKPIEIEQCTLEEPKSADIIKPLDYLSKSMNKVKQNIQKSAITGQAIKSSEKSNLGIFIVFIEIILIVGLYLTAKSIFY
ncbi:hypothetical protein HYX07_03715 [Candidatus Woesearchaeota archaeon]|nr:hypothetical protein [Candidatus Woesearchaeota archaeon]